MILAGLGCPNGCDSCCASHFFRRRHIKLLPTGADMYAVVARCLELHPEISLVVLHAVPRASPGASTSRCEGAGEEEDRELHDHEVYDFPFHAWTPCGSSLAARGGHAMTLEQLDWQLSRWMHRHGHALLRFGLGLVFVWFGAPKLVPGLSPADQLVAMTLPWFDPAWLLPSLGLAEIGIGLCLFHRPWLRFGLLLMAGHMLGTALPLFTLPEVAWKAFPVATLEGQYILKNVVLVAGAIVLGGAAGGFARAGAAPVRWRARRVVEGEPNRAAVLLEVD